MLGTTADTENHTLRLALVPFAITITNQPQGQTVQPGASVTFTVTANGRPAPTYQWYRNGVAITGATSESCTVSNAQESNAGDYTVVVSNAIGNVTSNKATLTVLVAPSSSSSDGGGGGGAMGPWFYLALALLAAARWATQRRNRVHDRT